MSRSILLILLSVSWCTAAAQDNWTTLLDASRDLGFSVYRPSEKDQHLVDSVKPIDDEDVYFQFSKAWAKRRVQEWAEKKGKEPENYILFFDVAQKRGNRSFNGFFLLDISLKPVLGGRQINESMVRLTVRHQSGEPILENVLWREFMSGRMGRLSPQVSFEVSGKDISGKFKRLKSAFETYLD